MRVKRYVADSIQEAIARVKSDLGRNAIILHTKPFEEGGVFGLFKQKRIEVIAAVDDEPKSRQIPPPKVPPQVSKPIETQVAVQPQMPQYTYQTQPQVQPQAMQIPETTYNQVAAAATATQTVEIENIHREIAEMKELIRRATFKPLATQAPIVKLKKDLESAEVEKGAALRAYFNEIGLSGDLIGFLLGQLSGDLLESENQEKALQKCQEILSSQLLVDSIRPVKKGEPLLIALIGPTGVGKTTTIAKLAATFNLFEGKNVGLITIDTYRIAAVEQLKTYGIIMNLPVEVVYTPSDLDRAIENLKDSDIILIDTAGRSPHNQGMMTELKQFLSYRHIDEIMLVISATTQLKDMVDIEKKFAKIEYSHLVFTKLDETSTFGSAVSLAWRVKRPIAYLTVGQNVPDDIEVAQASKMATRLFEVTEHE